MTAQINVLHLQYYISNIIYYLQLPCSVQSVSIAALGLYEISVF